MYEMKDEYRIGNESIDEQHTNLFAIADRAYMVLQDEFIPDKYDYVMAIIEELKEYTKKHFQDEEEYMASIQYKRLFTQKMQHAAFIEKLSNFNPDRVDEDSDRAFKEILEFLVDWLVNHILEVDMMITK